MGTRYVLSNTSVHKWNATDELVFKFLHLDSGDHRDTITERVDPTEHVLFPLMDVNKDMAPCRPAY